jgi:integrase
MKRQLDVLEKTPDQVEARALVKAMARRKEYLEASDTEIYPYDDDESFSARGLVLEDIRSDAEDLRDRAGPELASRYIKLATANVTPLAGLPEQWLAEVSGQVSGQTHSQHQTAVRRFITWAGGDATTVEEITRLKVGSYLSELFIRGDLARRTIKRHCSSLSSFWQWLISRGYAKENPFEGHKFGTTRKASEGRKGLSDTEIKRLLSGTSTEQYDETLHDLIRLALVTGARLNELCELKSSDVDRRDDGWWATVHEGKTAAATRSIPLHASVDAIIEKRLKGKGPYLFEGLIPGGPDKKRMWYVSKAFARYRKTVGVRERWRDFHALRNTFIEVMEGADVPESTVKLIVGHKRQSMTYGRYSKGTRVNLREASNKLVYNPEIMALIGVRPKSAILLGRSKTKKS